MNALTRKLATKKRKLLFLRISYRSVGLSCQKISMIRLSKLLRKWMMKSSVRSSRRTSTLKKRYRRVSLISICQRSVNYRQNGKKLSRERMKSSLI